VSGGEIYVANFGNNTIGAYTTLGATDNASLVSGLNGPYGIDVVTTPEPSTLALTSLGGALLLLFRRQRQQVD